MHYFFMNVVELTFSFLEWFCNLMLPWSKFIVKLWLNFIGIEIDGELPHDLQVHDNRFYSMILARSVTGFFTAYGLKYVDCRDLKAFYEKAFEANFQILVYFHPYRLCKYAVHKYFDALDIENTKKYVNEHYDKEGAIEALHNVSDDNVQYSTMFLEDLNEIEKANEEELKVIMNRGAEQIRDLYARKLKLEAGMSVLDIGCGFGGLAKHLAEKYNVHVTGVTLSQKMAEHAKRACKGLDVNIENIDYRLVTGKYDRIVSIQMFEHVGNNHHREYFENVNSLLKDDGLFLLQAHHVGHKYMPSYLPLFEVNLKMYNYFPRIEEVCSASKGLFIIEDIQNHGCRHGITARALRRSADRVMEEVCAKHGEAHGRANYMYAILAEVLGLNGMDRVYDYVFSKSGLRYAYNY